jgi:hypothetical protein
MPRPSPPTSRRRCPTLLRFLLHGIQWDIMGKPGAQLRNRRIHKESEGLRHQIYCAPMGSRRKTLCRRLAKRNERETDAGQTACKPGSVLAPIAVLGGDGWPFLWDVRRRTPLATDPGGDAETPLPVARRAAPIWSCSRWGLPCRFRCRSRGGLLPHRFTLASPASWRGGLFSVALSLESPPPDVIRHRVSVEPGLSSPGGCPPSAAIRPSDPRA